MNGGSLPTEIVCLPDESFLELFSYMNCEDGNNILLDVENPDSNLLRARARHEKDPAVCLSMNSFEEFREAFVEPIAESRGAQSLGLAFRGQAAKQPLHSTLKRFWDEFPDPPFRDGIPPYPRREADYRMADVNTLVQKHLFQFGAVPLPGRDHLYGILQHYGAPTPLLDWTLSLDIALFFAFEHAPQGGDDQVAIYMADIGKFHMLNWRAVHGPDVVPDVSKLRDLDPTRLDETWTFLRPASFGDIRFSVQQGIFSKQQFDTQYEMKSLDAFLDNPSPRYACAENQAWKHPCRESTRIPGTLWIVTLPVTERPKVMDYLAAHDVTRERLFVSWERVCSDLVSQCTNRLLSGETGLWNHLSAEDVEKIAKSSSANSSSG